MDVIATIKMLEALSQGADPQTGEILADDNPFNRPKIIRSLFLILDELRDVPRKPASKEKALPENAGKPWTAEDDKKLCKEFDNGANGKILTQMFNRTRGAIASRLVRLKKITERKELL